MKNFPHQISRAIVHRLRRHLSRFVVVNNERANNVQKKCGVRMEKRGKGKNHQQIGIVGNVYGNETAGMKCVACRR